MLTRTMVSRGPERDALFSLLRGCAPLRFLFFRLLPRLVFGRQFAPLLRGPAWLVHLAPTRDSQCIGRNIFGDRGTCGDVGASADSNGCNQSGITTDKNFVADMRRKFVEAVVVTGNRAGADVCFCSDPRISEIREVHRLGALADGALLQLHEIADPRTGF